MTNIDIYTLLQSKQHNPHYLSRYWKFIQSCSNIINSGYIEKHHICPKAKDLFPDYSDFKKHSWNKIDLSPRQHFIAHWMLWKAYGGTQSYAFHKIKRKRSNNTEYKSFRINSRTYELCKNDYMEYLKNRPKILGLSSGLCLATGLYEYTDKNDPRWKTGELVGPNKGKKTNFSSNNPSTNYVNCKTKDGVKLGLILKTDPRWVNKEVVGVNAGNCTNPGKATAYITKTGESIGKVLCSDHRWKTGEICSPNRYKAISHK